jgi:hypothetical protein
MDHLLAISPRLALGQPTEGSDEPHYVEVRSSTTVEDITSSVVNHFQLGDTPVQLLNKRTLINGKEIFASVSVSDVLAALQESQPLDSRLKIREEDESIELYVQMPSQQQRLQQQQRDASAAGSRAAGTAAAAAAAGSNDDDDESGGKIGGKYPTQQWMDDTVFAICLLGLRNENGEFLMKSQKVQADDGQLPIYLAR